MGEKEEDFSTVRVQADCDLICFASFGVKLSWIVLWLPVSSSRRLYGRSWCAEKMDANYGRIDSGA